MDFENEKKGFIKEHLFKIEDITEDILEKIENDEGIIIVTENGSVIDIDAVWSENDNYEDCWVVKIYSSYEKYCDVLGYHYYDSMRMSDLTINHIKNYMKM